MLIIINNKAERKNGFSCPLSTDLNSCAIEGKIGVNGCPRTIEVETEDDWYYEQVRPRGCPLNNTDIIIRKDMGLGL